MAAARYATFAALAPHEYPSRRQRLEQAIASGDHTYLTWFVHEVRRFYPFSPAVGGRVLGAFDWRGRRLRKGTRVVLDHFGTNHDPRA